uniref:Uncharacterized protein n=1 Tax=Rhodosorus marinus TaxID=101924 RepID=A0A7S0G0F9_9RHOD|mmetsp:Transcript_16736/g.24105  ORF Transcript_16736/g.24105 Transcript_16736/m.24105 type:complete len:119 (+) Transcript_16736:62-418(+)
MEMYDLLPQTETLRLLCLNLVRLGRVSQALSILEKVSELKQRIGIWSIFYVGRAASLEKETGTMQRVEDLMAKLGMPASDVYYSMPEDSSTSKAVAKRTEKNASKGKGKQEKKAGQRR